MGISWYIGISTISMAIFHSYVSHYQRVTTTRFKEVIWSDHIVTNRSACVLMTISWSSPASGFVVTGRGRGESSSQSKVETSSMGGPYGAAAHGVNGASSYQSLVRGDSFCLLKVQVELVYIGLSLSLSHFAYKQTFTVKSLWGWSTCFFF